jgi:hypothetical protein
VAELTGVRFVGALSTVLVVCALTLMSANTVAALVDVPETTPDGFLTLKSHEHPVHFLGLSPGDPAHWHIGTQLDGAQLSTLTLEVERGGELIEHPRGLTVLVERCDTEWTSVSDAGECTTGATDVLNIGPADVGPGDDAGVAAPVWDLAGLSSTTGKYLLVTLAVEDSTAARYDESLMGLTGTLGFGFTAAADDQVTPTPTDPTPASIVPPPGAAPGAARPPFLAVTGGTVLPLALLAAGLLGVGISSAMTRRRVPRSSHSSNGSNSRMGDKS